LWSCSARAPHRGHVPEPQEHHERHPRRGEGPDRAGLEAALGKVGDHDDDPLVEQGIVHELENDDVPGMLDAGPCLVGGTAWLFSREELAAGSTTWSSTRPARSRWQTRSPSGSQPATSFSSATRCSSPR
jgi:hypothetical protein